MNGNRLFGLGFRWAPDRKAWLGHGLELKRLAGSSWRLAPVDGTRNVRLLSSRKGTAEAREADVYAQLLDALWDAAVTTAVEGQPPAAG